MKLPNLQVLRNSIIALPAYGGPLLDATAKGDASMVSSSLRQGVTVNEPNERGATPSLNC